MTPDAQAKSPQRGTRQGYAERVLRVLVHIQQNLDAELSLDSLAAIANFSPFHFHRVFRGMVGESVGQHVRRLRLERAAQRLKHSERSIVSIALEAGYEAHESFSRSFRAAFGCAPRDFRSAASLVERMSSPTAVHYVGGTHEVRFEPLPEEVTMKVEIRNLGPKRIAFLRHRGPYREVGETWEALMDWAGRECLVGPESSFFGLCWDDPEVTGPKRCRYDACLTVANSVEASGEVGVTTFAGGRFAVTLHQGPYERLGETYAALVGRWFPAHGLEPAAPPSLESYLDDPDTTEPEELLTEVMMPIRQEVR